MLIEGQRVGGYLHGYLLTIGPSCGPASSAGAARRAGIDRPTIQGGYPVRICGYVEARPSRTILFFFATLGHELPN